MNTDLMFSSKRDDWETPPKLFQKYHDRHHFTLDVCANEKNHKLPNWLGRFQYVETGEYGFTDGLAHTWTGRCWCNPPYGRGIERWVKKAHDSVFMDATADLVILLLPARTDTRWFHQYIYNPRDFDAAMGTQYRFLKGRVKYLEDGNETNPAPFPSMVVKMEREVLPF